jgi:hypothetical protein
MTAACHHHHQLCMQLASRAQSSWSRLLLCSLQGWELLGVLPPLQKLERWPGRDPKYLFHSRSQSTRLPSPLLALATTARWQGLLRTSPGMPACKHWIKAQVNKKSRAAQAARGRQHMTTTHHTSEQHSGLTGLGRPARWLLQLLEVACEIFMLLAGFERAHTCKQVLSTRTAARLDTPVALLQENRVVLTPLGANVCLSPY